jgi:hypothetical protein
MPGADRDDDEDDFEPFQHDGFERSHAGDPVQAFPSSLRRFAKVISFGRENGVFIMERNDTGCSQ